VTTLALVGGVEDEQVFTSKAKWTGHWVHREAPGNEGKDDAELLLEALEGLTLPQGEGFVWIAAETGIARSCAAISSTRPLNRANGSRLPDTGPAALPMLRTRRWKGNPAPLPSSDPLLSPARCTSSEAGA
jgi:hypothetical protein